MSVSCFSTRIPAHKPCFVRTWQAATRAHCFPVTRDRNKNPLPRVLSVTGCVFTAAFWDLRLQPGKPGFPAFGETGEAGPELAGGGEPSSCRCHRAAHREDNSRPEASRWAVREPEQLSGRGKNIPQWHHGQRPKTQTPPYKMQLSPGISFQGLQCRAGDVSLWASLCTQECSVSFTWRTAWQQRQLWLIQVPHQRQPEHLSRTRILIHNRCSVSTVDLRNDFSLVKWAVFKMRGLTQNPAPVGAE